MIVDHQAHWYPPAYLDWLARRSEPPRIRRDDGAYRFEGLDGWSRALSPDFFDLDVQLAGMDEHGIDAMVCSPSPLGDVTGLDPASAREAAELLNEQLAGVQRDHPDRIAGLAVLPLQDPPAALEVLDRAIGELGLRGVCIVPHIAGAPVVTEATLPVWRRIGELGVPLFLHPAHRSSVCRPGDPVPIETGLSWMYDTSLAALSFVYGGTLDACPGLTIVHPHLGGTLPFLVNRIAGTERHSEKPHGASRPLSEYLRERFYVDTVNPTPGALRMAIATYGLERILFATDFPWVPRQVELAHVPRDASEAEARAILHDNGPRALPFW